MRKKIKRSEADWDKMDQLCVITVNTGNWFKMHQAALPGRSFVYTTHLKGNRADEFVAECDEKGWIPLDIPHLEPTENLLEGTMQSKHVKFLNVELPEGYKYIFYMDHKVMVNDLGIAQILNQFDDENVLMLGKEAKRSVYHEFMAAMNYDRYREQTVTILQNTHKYEEGNAHGYIIPFYDLVPNMTYLMWNVENEDFKELQQDLWNEFQEFPHIMCQMMMFFFRHRWSHRIKEIWTGEFTDLLDAFPPEGFLVGGKTY
jgi:hypothetical protein